MSKMTIMTFELNQHIKIKNEIYIIIQVEKMEIRMRNIASLEEVTVKLLDLACFDVNGKVDFSVDNMNRELQYIAIDKFSEDSIKKYYLIVRLMRFMARNKGISWKSTILEKMYEEEKIHLASYLVGLRNELYPSLTYLYQLYRKFVKSGFQLSTLRSKGAIKAPWAIEKRKKLYQIKQAEEIMKTEKITSAAHLGKRLREINGK